VPGFGWAGMMMPGWAPSTPDSSALRAHPACGKTPSYLADSTRRASLSWRTSPAVSSWSPFSVTRRARRCRSPHDHLVSRKKRVTVMMFSLVSRPTFSISLYDVPGHQRR